METQLFISDSITRILSTCANLLLALELAESDNTVIELKDWNNNLGIEFDLLQSVFPGEIPKHDFESSTSLELPVSDTRMPKHEIARFIILGLLADASFTIHWPTKQVSVSHTDMLVTIEYPTTMRSQIETILSNVDR